MDEQRASSKPTRRWLVFHLFAFKTLELVCPCKVAGIDMMYPAC